MATRLAEAQQLYEALGDPLLRPALETFVNEQKIKISDQLLSAVRQHLRDTMKEARFAGKVEAYEELLSELEHFSLEQLRSANQ